MINEKKLNAGHLDEVFESSNNLISSISRLRSEGRALTAKIAEIEEEISKMYADLFIGQLRAIAAQSEMLSKNVPEGSLKNESLNQIHSIGTMYQLKCQQKSDINEHLPTLYSLALDCNTIAEFGVRGVVSTYAFAHARPKRLICVDISKNNSIDIFLHQCRNENIQAEFHICDSRSFEMDPVDMIFIDTLHTYSQLKAELNKLGNKALKYLVFHDTVTYATADEQYVYSGVNSSENGDNQDAPNKTGLVAAILEFMSENPHWTEKFTSVNNNGLTVLQRK